MMVMVVMSVNGRVEMGGMRTHKQASKAQATYVADAGRVGPLDGVPPAAEELLDHLALVRRVEPLRPLRVALLLAAAPAAAGLRDFGVCVLDMGIWWCDDYMWLTHGWIGAPTTSARLTLDEEAGLEDDRRSSRSPRSRSRSLSFFFFFFFWRET